MGLRLPQWAQKEAIEAFQNHVEVLAVLTTSSIICCSCVSVPTGRVTGLMSQEGDLRLLKLESGIGVSDFGIDQASANKCTHPPQKTARIESISNRIK